MLEIPQVHWQKIDTVLLDMDGTLLDLHFDNYFWRHYLPKAYADKHQLTLEKAKEQLFAQFEAIRGTLEWYCLDYWCEVLKIDITALKKEVEHLIDLRPGAVEFLDWLGEQGKHRVLITNAHPGSIELKMLNTSLGDRLDRVLSSHLLGAPKEQQAFWQLLQTEEPYSPEACLFIDDTASVLEAASQYGVGTVLGVYMPDSKGSPRTGEHRFPLLREFSDIMVI